MASNYGGVAYPHGLCACCAGSVSACCLGYWCPCCSFGKTAEAALTGNCCGHCCVYFVLRNLSVATPFTFCFAPFSACLGGSQRTILEQKYGLSSQGFCCNCCIHTWCSCCALIQEQKAVQHFEKMGCSPGSPQQIQMQSFSLQTSPIYAQQAGQLQLHQPVMIRT